jgi:hypothetical protein
VQVVHDTWENRKISNTSATLGNYSLYSGALGTVLLLFKAYLATGNRANLVTYAEIMASYDWASGGDQSPHLVCYGLILC